MCAQKLWENAIKVYLVKFAGGLLCTKLKSKQLKCVNVKEWMCQNCNKHVQDHLSSDLESEVNNLNKSSDFNLSNVDFQNMIKCYLTPSFWS